MRKREKTGENERKTEKYRISRGGSRHNIFKRIGAVLLAVSMAAYSGIGDGKVCGLKGITVEAAEIVETGSCGENATYTLDSDGMMIISGTGEIRFPNLLYCKNKKINKIVIEEGIEKIGSYEFYGCDRLTSVELPSGVTDIGSKAFYGCGSLSSINIPSGVIKIESFAFCECNSLSNIKIPSSVSNIGTGAFSECSCLKEISVAQDNNQYSSENGVLYNKDRSVLICCPGGKTGNYTIPTGVTTVEGAAFDGCNSLTGIQIPASVTEISKYAFRTNENLKEINVDNGNTMYRSENGVLYNKDRSVLLCCPGGKTGSYVIPAGVTAINTDAFYNCSSLSNIEIPSSVTEIGNEAFAYCGSLVSIKIPSGVTEIGRAVFGCCSSLVSIEIPSCVTEIGEEAFLNCSNLISINIPAGVTEIGRRAFAYCSSLKDINIPNSVTYLNLYAFQNCSSLTSINIPAGINYFSNCIFENCSSLEEINIEYENLNYCSEKGVAFDKTMSTLICCPAGKSGDYVIPDGVTDIERDAFKYCSGLTDIRIPDSVENIGDNAFDGCSSLKSIEIPSRVTSIEDGTFQECSSLTSVRIPSDVTYIGGFAFNHCNSLNAIEIPSEVTSIKMATFQGCSSLTSVRIPANVSIIGDFAFNNCSSLKTIDIPSGVTSIGEKAFTLCDCLTDIEIPENTTSIGVKAFGYTYDEVNNCYLSIQNFTIYGSTGTEAERYANDNGFTFVPFVTQLFSEDNITLQGEKSARIASDMTLDTKEITEDSIGTEIDKQQLEQCINTTIQEISSDTIENINYKAYDIRLLDKDQQPVQPKEKVTVRIPVPVGFNAENCHVYRLESDNTFKDMRASCSEDTLTFKTDHFSVYVITEQMLSITPSQALGDVNDDEAVDIADALLIARYDAGLIELEDAQLACSDVNGDSDTDIADALLIARYDAGLIDSLE